MWHGTSISAWYENSAVIILLATYTPSSCAQLDGVEIVQKAVWVRFGWLGVLGKLYGEDSRFRSFRRWSRRVCKHDRSKAIGRCKNQGSPTSRRCSWRSDRLHHMERDDFGTSRRHENKYGEVLYQWVPLEVVTSTMMKVVSLASLLKIEHTRCKNHTMDVAQL